jgi:hypothetical protein
MRKIVLLLALLMVISCEQKIGGDTDEHGCLIGAGYTWCEAKQKCLRTWEETCEEDVTFCNADEDCIPMPGCHPLSCINSKFENNYEKPEACTLMFNEDAAYNDEDCGCKNNKCINLNLKEEAITEESEVIEPVEEVIEEKENTEEYCSELGGVLEDECSPPAASVFSVEGKLCCLDFKLTEGEARRSAEDNCGSLKDSYFYNEETHTWWFDLQEEKQGCSPACVVDEVHNTAEINWRCTGAYHIE